jgi:hypothetical protein
MRFTAMIVLAATLALVPLASARQVEDWPYERLFKEADLVVIATAKATEETHDPAPDNRWKSSLVGQRTTFTVDAVLKGERAAGGTLAVLHFKLKPGVLTQDGPLLVAFRTKGLAVEGGGMKKYKALLGTPQYLLFLKAADNGRFVPVSGQADPALSVKEVYAPLPEVMDEK